MFRKFLPKAPKFFDYLTFIAENAHKAAELLNNVANNTGNLSEIASDVHIIENKCDEITHSIKNDLNETFITPIDREDIFSITNALDDVVDAIDRVTSKINIYQLKTPLKFGPQLASILLAQTEQLVLALKFMNNNHEETLNKLVYIRKLETEGDNVFKESIVYLFEFEKDIVEIIKKKEILENFEKAVDRCQTVTLAIEGALIKNM